MLAVELDSPLARACAPFGRREQGKNMFSAAIMWMLPRRRSEVALALGGAWAAGPAEMTIDVADQSNRPFMIDAAIGRIEPKYDVSFGFSKSSDRAPSNRSPALRRLLNDGGRSPAVPAITV